MELAREYFYDEGVTYAIYKLTWGDYEALLDAHDGRPSNADILAVAARRDGKTLTASEWLEEPPGVAQRLLVDIAEKMRIGANPRIVDASPLRSVSRSTADPASFDKSA